MNLKPKIAVIGLKGLPAFGGAATVGENIIMGLKDKFDFTVFSSRPYTDLATGNYNGINQIVFNGKSKSAFNTLLYYLKSMLYCLFVGKFDLIHLHHAESGFITPILRSRYKVILTMHGIHSRLDSKFNTISNILFRIFDWINIKTANITISVSLPDAIEYRKKFNQKILYIPNGVRIASSYHSKNNSKYICFAANRIYKIKGLHILLKAIKLIDNDIKLKVIGDLDHVKHYKDEILDLIIGMNVEIIKTVDKKKLFEIISDSVLFVFPSNAEAMSMMLLEVAALNVPIIASDIPANRAILDTNEALFFKNDDASDLSEKLNWALNHNDLMSVKAEKAKSKIENYFSWEMICQHYFRLLNLLISSSN